MSYHLVTLLLGSNLGNRKENLERALNAISGKIGEIISKSEMMDTQAVEFVSNNIFCNIAIVIKTQFSPFNILNSVKGLERDMGRIEDSSVTLQYKDRIIDIDIVKYDNLKFASKKLVIPHDKHLYERDFSKILLFNLNTF